MDSRLESDFKNLDSIFSDFFNKDLTIDEMKTLFRTFFIESKALKVLLKETKMVFDNLFKKLQDNNITFAKNPIRLDQIYYTKINVENNKHGIEKKFKMPYESFIQRMIFQLPSSNPNWLTNIQVVEEILLEDFITSYLNPNKFIIFRTESLSLNNIYSDPNIKMDILFFGSFNSAPIYYQSFNLCNLIHNTKKKLGQKFWKDPILVGTDLFVDIDDEQELSENIRSWNFRIDPFSNETAIGKEYSNYQKEFNFPTEFELDLTKDLQLQLDNILTPDQYIYYDNSNKDSCLNMNQVYGKDEIYKRTQIPKDEIHLALDYANFKLYKKYEIFSSLPFCKSLICDFPFEDFLFQGYRVDLTQYSGKVCSNNIINQLRCLDKNLNSIYNGIDFIMDPLIQRDPFKRYLTTSLKELDWINLTEPENKNLEFSNSLFNINRIDFTNKIKVKNRFETWNRVISDEWIKSNYDFDIKTKSKNEKYPIPEINKNKICLMILNGFDLTELKMIKSVHQFYLASLLKRSEFTSIKDFFKSIDVEVSDKKIVKIKFDGEIQLPKNYSGYLTSKFDIDPTLEPSSVTKFKKIELIITDKSLDKSDSWVPDFIAEEISELFKFINKNTIGIYSQFKIDAFEVFLKNINLDNQGPISFNLIHNFFEKNIRQTDEIFTIPIVKSCIFKQMYDTENYFGSDFISTFRFKIPAIFSSWAFLAETFIYTNALKIVYFKENFLRQHGKDFDVLVTCCSENFYYMIETKET